MDDPTLPAAQNPLTPTETRLLSLFVLQPGRAFSRRELVLQVIGTTVEERTIDQHIKAIRRKLGDRGRCLQTVRGIGYRWAPDLELARYG